MTDKQGIAHVIRSLRGTRSLRAYAADVGVTAPTVLQWERGGMAPTRWRVREIVKDGGLSASQATALVSLIIGRDPRLSPQAIATEAIAWLS